MKGIRKLIGTGIRVERRAIGREKNEKKGGEIFFGGSQEQKRSPVPASVM